MYPRAPGRQGVGAQGARARPGRSRERSRARGHEVQGPDAVETVKARASSQRTSAHEAGTWRPRGSAPARLACWRSGCCLLPGWRIRALRAGRAETSRALEREPAPVLCAHPLRAPAACRRLPAPCASCAVRLCARWPWCMGERLHVCTVSTVCTSARQCAVGSADAGDARTMRHVPDAGSSASALAGPAGWAGVGGLLSPAPRPARPRRPVRCVKSSFTARGARIHVQLQLGLHGLRAARSEL